MLVTGLSISTGNRRYRRLLERFRRLQIGRDKREKSGHYQNAFKKKLETKNKKKIGLFHS